MTQCYSVLDLHTPCATVHHPDHPGAFEPPFVPKLNSILPGKTFLPASETAIVEDIFMPSGLEVIFSQHFLHHPSLSISFFLLLPSSTSRSFHTSYAGSSIFVLSLPQRGEKQTTKPRLQRREFLSSPRGTDGLLERTTWFVWGHAAHNRWTWRTFSHLFI